MALKQSELNKIPQRNKDLAFGYVKSCEKENKSNIPSMIKYLCLIYLNQNKDTFDANNTHKMITIDGDKIKSNTVKLQTSYMKNIISSGIHIWKFKCISTKTSTWIGITKCMKLKKNMLYLDYDKTDQIGYAFSSYGMIDYEPHCREPYMSGWVDGDIIEMKVDFNTRELSCKVNDQDRSKTFYINDDKYKAAITLHGFDVSFELLCYQHSY